jgi:predicted negative regulator of RcsB-dependent stress response
MNRTQFWILNGLAGFVVLLFITQIFLVRAAIYEQNQMAMAQQALQQGQAFQGNLKQLALRIVQVSQQTNDQALKDLLTRQQISFTPQGQDSATPAPAPAPTH